MHWNKTKFENFQRNIGEAKNVLSKLLDQDLSYTQIKVFKVAQKEINVWLEREELL